MAATLVGEETETSFEKTIEPANEVTMEKQAVVIETEQPRAVPSPDFNDENEHSDGKVNGSMSNSTESDGFNEEAVNGSATHEKSETKAPEGIEIKAKTAAVKVDVQKSESGQPTKLKSKKKEDKGIEHILKALSSLQTTEEKLAALCKKYADLHEEHRVVQSSFKQTQRKLTVTTREKDQLQTEHTKAVMAKSKLENLCRELQKHNQTIRQESIQRAKEEDEKRKEISQKFQTTIGEIQTQMGENHERNKQLREENADLAGKLKKFIEQSEARELQVAKVIQHRELEQKLADAKLEQATAILQEEQGRSQKERELLILQSTEYFKKLQLKDQELNMYKERYDEFQSTIKKSEEMFGKFKTEMDKMGKRCKKLEKDGAQWKTKWEGANRALLEMAEEKTKYDRERGLLVTKITKLESLCRAMQAERQARKLLESEKISVTQELANLGLTKETLTQMAESMQTNSEVAKANGSSQTSEVKGQDLEVNEGKGSGDRPLEESEGSVEKEDSDTSCASEQTDVTVIQQKVSHPDISQSDVQKHEVTSTDQLEKRLQESTDSGQSNATS